MGVSIYVQHLVVHADAVLLVLQIQALAEHVHIRLGGQMQRTLLEKAQMQGNRRTAHRPWDEEGKARCAKHRCML